MTNSSLMSAKILHAVRIVLAGFLIWLYLFKLGKKFAKF